MGEQNVGDLLEEALNEEFGKHAFKRCSSDNKAPCFASVRSGEVFLFQIKCFPKNNGRICVTATAPFHVNLDNPQEDSPTNTILKHLNTINRLDNAVASINPAGTLEFQGEIPLEDVAEGVREITAFADICAHSLAKVVFGGWILPDAIEKIGDEVLTKALLDGSMLSYVAEHGAKTRIEKTLEALRRHRKGKEASNEPLQHSQN